MVCQLKIAEKEFLQTYLKDEDVDWRGETIKHARGKDCRVETRVHISARPAGYFRAFALIASRPTIPRETTGTDRNLGKHAFFARPKQR